MTCPPNPRMPRPETRCPGPRWPGCWAARPRPRWRASSVWRTGGSAADASLRCPAPSRAWRPPWSGECWLARLVADLGGGAGAACWCAGARPPQPRHPPASATPARPPPAARAGPPPRLCWPTPRTRPRPASGTPCTCSEAAAARRVTPAPRCRCSAPAPRPGPSSPPCLQTASEAGAAPWPRAGSSS